MDEINKQVLGLLSNITQIMNAETTTFDVPLSQMGPVQNEVQQLSVLVQNIMRGQFHIVVIPSEAPDIGGDGVENPAVNGAGNQGDGTAGVDLVSID